MTTKVRKPNDWNEAFREMESTADKICDLLAALEHGLPEDENIATSTVMGLLGEAIAVREPTLAAWLGLQGEDIEAARPLALLMERRSSFRIRTATRPPEAP